MPSPQMRRQIEAIRSTIANDTGIASRRHAGSRALDVDGPDVNVAPVSEPGVAGEWVWVDGVPEGRVVLLLHGGGFVAGSPVIVRRFGAALSRRARVRCMNPQYRLAPEHPCPAGVEDALACYQWLLSQGYEPKKIVLGGQSAGGAIAIAMLVAARDQGLPLPRGTFVISPPVDLTLSSSTMTAVDSQDPLASLQELRRNVSHYLGDLDARDPLASPLFADLRGLPPLHIEVGSTERLLDDARNLARAAQAADVTVTLEEVEGAIHNFPNLAPDTPEAAAATARIANLVDRWLV